MSKAGCAAWPEKKREVVTATIDSTMWNRLRYRDDDVVVASFGKTGTTWTQAIIVQLIHGAPEVVRVGQICRWIDCAWGSEARMAAVEAQTHRRVLKSHLPADALIFSPRAKYIYVARDGRDVAWSAHNHRFNQTDGFYAERNAQRPAGIPEIRRPQADVRAYYRNWIEGRESEMDFWAHVRSWWALRDLPNVLLLHFQNLKDDPEGRIATIADFLGIEIGPGMMQRIVKHTSFEHMKAHANAMFPGMPFVDGARTFINKGSNGRWREVLCEQEIAEYDSRAVAELGPDCAWWLGTGSFPATAPSNEDPDHDDGNETASSQGASANPRRAAAAGMRLEDLPNPLPAGWTEQRNLH
jgi:aryl sulfotransferase